MEGYAKADEHLHSTESAAQIGAHVTINLSYCVGSDAVMPCFCSSCGFFCACLFQALRFMSKIFTNVVSTGPFITHKAL